MSIAVQCCLTCQKELHHGRIDKRFCNEGCRAIYNNQVMREERSDIKIIDAILKHNRRLLKRTLKDKDTLRVEKEYLIQQGFRFDFYTHHYQNQRGDHYSFCYNYGYLFITDDSCLIVKSKIKG